MRVAIVNDLPLVTEALRRIVLSDATHEVVWTAQDGEQAVRQCRRDTPDVVLMDLIMPNVNGAEATRRIMQENPCAVLVVTAGVSANFALVCEAMGYGAYDAVCTPVLGNRSPAEAGAELLGKLAAVERVNRRLAGKNAGGSHVGNRPVDSDLQVSRRQAEPVDSRLPLVAIGTSTGGPPALGALLKGLAEDFPAGIVIVQHIGQEFVGSLVEWLQAQTRLTVRVAANGQMPEPRTVLVAGSDDHLVMGRDGRLTYRAQPVDCPYRPSVDELFYSLADHWSRPGIAVLLTGIGRDGARGLLKLRQAGWHTVGQDKASSVVYGMPQAAAEINAAARILPLHQIAAHLQERVRSLARNP